MPDRARMDGVAFSAAGADGSSEAVPPLSAPPASGRRAEPGGHDGRVHDLIAVGFGPSGLALAVALDEAVAAPGGGSIDAVFLERKPEFSWHEGMLIPGARMQVSCLKDLATLRDPRSPSTFFAYLADVGRLDRFVNLGTLRPTRVEFDDYLRWAARRVRSPVRYGCEVVAVEPIAGAGGDVALLRVVTRDRRTGAVTGLRARNLVLGAGAVARVPPGVDVGGDHRVFHSGDFLPHLAEHFPDRADPLRFVVVGDGQSGAEIVDHLATSYRHAQVTGVTRGFGYRPMDETPFVNEVFLPGWVDTFHGLGPDKRDALLATLRNTNYGVVDTDLVERLYRTMYESAVTGPARVTISPFHHLRGARAGPDCVVLDLHDWVGERTVQVEADAVVLATGYAVPNPHPLLACLGPHLETGDGGRYRAGRDYRVAAAGGFAPRVYVQGYAEATHGIGDTLLSVAAVRAGEIAASVAASLGPASAVAEPARGAPGAEPGSDGDGAGTGGAVPALGGEAC